VLLRGLGLRTGGRRWSAGEDSNRQSNDPDPRRFGSQRPLPGRTCADPGRNRSFLLRASPAGTDRRGHACIRVLGWLLLRDALRPELSTDPARRERFNREARGRAEGIFRRNV